MVEQKSAKLVTQKIEFPVFDLRAQPKKMFKTFKFLADG